MPTIEREGLRIVYDRYGSGPAVILVQGVGVIGGGWRPQVAALQSRWTVITIDNRGIGRSTLDDRHLTIEDMAADVLAVADAEKLTRFHLAGHSMGGVIAQHVALGSPDRVLSLGLLCTFLKGRQGTMVAPRMLGAAMRSRIGTRAMRRRAFVELVMPRSYLAGIDRDLLCVELGDLFGRDLADQPPIVMRQLRAMGRYDASSRLSRLAGTPTLVVSGSDDCIARPGYGRALAAAIPGATYVELENAGHALTIQRAADVNALLIGLFSRHDDGAAGLLAGASVGVGH